MIKQHIKKKTFSFAKLCCFTAMMTLLVSCSGQQAIFDAASEQGSQIVTLWWIIFGVSLFAFIVVMGFLTFSLFRKREDKGSDKGLKQLLIVVISLTCIFLVSSLIASYQLSPDKLTKNKDPDLIVEVVGLQYWWRIKYFTPEGEFLFETANEIVLPVDKTVTFKLKAADVIHTFWIPRFTGKMDMIPGQTNELTITPQKTGRYRGQCAEFCGDQHAKMSLFADVYSDEDYKDWKENQMTPQPVTLAEKFPLGSQVYQESGCIQCHSIQGLYQAKEMQGPDLTHLGSRSTLAAASIPNEKGHLGGWISDPQSVKPGNLMPPTELNSEDFNALLEFISQLK